MKQFYRLSPVLWELPGQHTSTVYSIDRMPKGPLASYVTCCARCRDDPAWWWAGPTFLRLVMPREAVGCCMGPQDISDGVVWSQFPSWLLWAQGHGYSLNEGFSFSKLDPNTEITLIYDIA